MFDDRAVTFQILALIIVTTAALSKYMLEIVSNIWNAFRVVIFADGVDNCAIFALRAENTETFPV
jgi:hypothetical protein